MIQSSFVGRGQISCEIVALVLIAAPAGYATEPTASIGSNVPNGSMHALTRGANQALRRPAPSDSAAGEGGSWMTRARSLTHERLIELLHYDPVMMVCGSPENIAEKQRRLEWA